MSSALMAAILSRGDELKGFNFCLGLYSLSGKTSYRQNLAKSRSREIGCYNDRIVLKFDRHLGSIAAEMVVKFQSDWKSLNTNLAASRLHEILR